MPTMPPCPVCRTSKHVNPHGRDGYYCGKCNGLFDNEPDEGGDFSDRNPAVRLEREERRREYRGRR